MSDFQSVIVERQAKLDEGLQSLASLRMVVFRGWPYLYDGSIAYEEKYLREFLASDDAALVLARIGIIPVGMATASPLRVQPVDICAPLNQTGFDVGSGFYFGESVVLPQFRGIGLGHRFFDEREAAAREARATFVTFCAVIRPDDHPSRPTDTRDLQPFWRKRGYSPIDGCVGRMAWPERGSIGETEHEMQFWWRPL